MLLGGMSHLNNKLISFKKRHVWLSRGLIVDITAFSRPYLYIYISIYLSRNVSYLSILYPSRVSSQRSLVIFSFSFFNQQGEMEENFIPTLNSNNWNRVE